MFKIIKMKKIITLLMFMLSMNLFAQTGATLNDSNDEAKLEMSITNKDEVFRFLFMKHSQELKDEDCHRRLMTSRAPVILLAMGCIIESVEIYSLPERYNRMKFKGYYTCPGKKTHFSAYCFKK